MPKGTSPLAGEKPKPKRRRSKPAQAVASAPAPITPPARFISVEKQVPMKQKKTSWVFAGLQLLFAVAVIVGAYFLFHQVQKISEEARKREMVVQEQLKAQVGEVQEKFDMLIDTWQKQKTDELSATARKDFSVAGTSMSGSHLARLGELELSGTHHRFSANPDIFGTAGGLLWTCSKPLVVDENGYCDVIEVAGVQAIESVDVLYDANDSIDRIMKQVQIPLPNGEYFVWVVDLGTPVIEGRDVFAPVDEDAQKQAVTEYVRTILKHEDLPEVLAENLNAFDDLIEHLRLQP